MVRVIDQFRRSCSVLAGVPYAVWLLGKWVHNIGGLAMLLVYGALIALPFFALARGELRPISTAPVRCADGIDVLLP